MLVYIFFFVIINMMRFGKYIDLAVSIVEQHKTLAVAEDGNGETPLQVLARKPLAFSCNSSQGLWITIVRTG